MKKQVNKKVVGGIGVGAAVIGGGIYLLTKLLGKTDDDVMEVNPEDIVDETDFEEEVE